jgi:hypothetical protein
MAYLKHFSLVLGAAVAAGAVALPAHADNVLDAANSNLELVPSYLSEGDLSSPTEVEAADSTPGVDPTTVGSSLDNDNVFSSEASLLSMPAATDASGGLFQAADIQSALLAATVEPAAEISDTVNLAQSTSSPYGGVAPAYLGVGGNIGIIEDGSAIGQFGFAVISKISLGPRFALRPSFLISEDWTSFTIPLTYNFNTMALGGFRFQPYVGAGVDIPFGNDVGVLIDAGADIPISRDFTLNTAANFKVSGGFNMGLMFGVAYNFPFIFE